jgi:hypothetical protein
MLRFNLTFKVSPFPKLSFVTVVAVGNQKMDRERFGFGPIIKFGSWWLKIDCLIATTKDPLKARTAQVPVCPR